MNVLLVVAPEEIILYFILLKDSYSNNLTLS